MYMRDVMVDTSIVPCAGRFSFSRKAAVSLASAIRPVLFEHSCLILFDVFNRASIVLHSFCFLVLVR